jgi:hypothetical protein
VYDASDGAASNRITVDVVRGATADKVVVNGFERGAPFDNLLSAADKIGVKTLADSRPTDPLFKVVVVVPNEASHDNANAADTAANDADRFTLVVSMSHVLGDGHTYYKLFHMLSEDTPVVALSPKRKEDVVRASSWAMEGRDAISGMSSSAMLISAFMGVTLRNALVRARVFTEAAVDVAVFEVDRAEVDKQKVWQRAVTF